MVVIVCEEEWSSPQEMEAKAEAAARGTTPFRKPTHTKQETLLADA